MNFYESVLELPVHFLNDAYNLWVTELNERDIAHDENHLMWTAMNAFNLMRNYKLDDRERVAILVAAYAHDVGNIENREYHEFIGADWVLDYIESNHDVFVNQLYDVVNNVVRNLKPDAEIWKMTVHECIRKHRASFKGTRNTLYEKIVAAADRGVPDIKLYFYRSYIYSRNKFGYNHQEGVYHSWEHIHEKYLENGYGMRDKLLVTMYPEATRKLWDDIRNTSKEDYGMMAFHWADKFEAWRLANA